MRPLRLFIFTLSFFCLGFHAVAAAVQVTINWPSDTLGNYFLQGFMAKPSTGSGTYAVEEGKGGRLVGRGFDINFNNKNGKLVFLQRGATDGATGIRFDGKTNTFSFVTVDIKLVVKNCDVNVSVDNPAPTPSQGDFAADGTRTVPYKVIYGLHNLIYAGTRVDFKVDAHGVVSFQTPVAGISSQGPVISVEGFPFEVATSAKNWLIQRSNKKNVSGDGTVYLLPDSYVFQGGKSTVPFVVNSDGLLAAQAEGPYAEVLNLQDPADASSAPAGKIMIPGGEARYAARMQQEKTDQALYDQTLATSANATWKKDFSLTDVMKVRDFAEEQLSYPIELPAAVKQEGLKLLAFADHKVRVAPFQLSRDSKGTTTLFFRTDLPQGATRLFRLVSGFDAKGVAAASVEAPALQAGGNASEAVLGNGLLQVRVPAGHQDFAGGKPFAQVQAPILDMARTARPMAPMAKGSLIGPETLRVDSVDAKLVESGPLFARYQIAYKLEGGKAYTALLELRAGESHVRVAESLEGFTPDDQAFFRLDYGKGLLDPDHRLAGWGSGYDLFSGDYDRDVKEGKLNYAIGLFTPNGLGLMRSTAFYTPDGASALLISIDRIREWQTFKRALWSSSSAFENIRFYSIEGRKYLTAGLSGAKRFWVLALIPGDECILKTLPGISALATGPECRLYNQLAMWSLNAYKDRMPDWPEKLDAAPFNTPGFTDFQYYKDYVPLSYEDYKKKYLERTWFHDVLSYSSDFGGYSDRAVPAFFAEYAISRATWTPEQRAQIRQILLCIADYVEGDDNQPHHSMLSGHPNFVMDTKQAIPFAVATFSTHPKAKFWRDSYMDFYNEWLDKYERKDVPELNTRGGRWTENIACYVGQCFVGLAPDQTLLKWYDGTELAKNPQLLTLIRWMRDSFMSPNDGVRMIPPEGAHSFNFEPDHIGRKVLFQLCKEIADAAPQLSAEMHWMETNGKEGTKPDVRSTLFTDYGVVFHHDFAGPHESYAHMQNITGIDYRWSGAGVVYYGARNKVWSYNTAETNGDEFDWNQISAFNVKGKGLTPGPTNQLLYDFDFAQFYRQPGAEGDAYVARSLMLLRDDYLVISDEVRDEKVPGTFNWATIYDPPQIYQVKPGAPVQEKVTRDPQPVHPGNPDRTGKVFSYSGKGDFLTVVAPAAVKTESTRSGVIVNGEYVFASQNPEEIKQGTASFAGTYGYARPNQLALFQGTKIGLDDFELRRDGGDFGVSAAVDQKRIIGRIVGRKGGTISIVPPKTLFAAKAVVTINGDAVPHNLQNGAITFSVEIGQGDGLKNYEISF